MRRTPERGELVRRLLLVGGLLAISLVLASQAIAATTVPVSMTLIEPLKAGTPGSSPCPDIAIEFNCGSGEVLPFGHATEEVSLNVCGDFCNFRAIDLPQGSIFLEETVTNFSCPGVCGSQGLFGGRLTISVADVVIDGTGIFAGATGTLTGTVGTGGWHGLVQLTGTITLNA
jgi:hypothetical protein